MTGGKTTRLLTDLERSKHQHKKSIVFKPQIDDRYSATEIVTHSGWKWPGTVVKEGADILAILADQQVPSEIVAVDEAFMIPGIADVLIWLFQSGVTIGVSTLDLDYKGKTFREVEKMLPWATRVEKCPAVCVECGRDAFYTHKKLVSNDEEIEIGGAELYEARCWRHIPFIINNLPDVHRFK